MLYLTKRFSGDAHMKKTKLKYFFIAMTFIMLFYIGQTNSVLTEGSEQSKEEIGRASCRERV